MNETNVDVDRLIIPHWWHWLVYRVFRWVWNPVFASNPAYRSAIADTILLWEARNSQFKSVDEMVACTTPRFYAEYWKTRDKVEIDNFGPTEIREYPQTAPLYNDGDNTNE